MPDVRYRGNAATLRACGSCTACCHSVPVKDLGLLAFTPCRHERTLPHLTTGCAIYQDRPRSCRMWSCQWLTSADWPDDLRPDRCGIVIDPVPDFATINGEDIPAVQMWAMPGHEEEFLTNPHLQKVVDAVFAKGWCVLWRVPDPSGDSDHLTAVLLRDKRTGQKLYSPPGRGNAAPTFEDHGRLERLRSMLDAEPA